MSEEIYEEEQGEDEMSANEEQDKGKIEEEEVLKESQPQPN